ncbi:hypothetical protein KY289_013425 [Solanum tuberosum]|nr:hypothetical protein KY289_013425 [Solanum tuberosum]
MVMEYSSHGIRARGPIQAHHDFVNGEDVMTWLLPGFSILCQRKLQKVWNMSLIRSNCGKSWKIDTIKQMVESYIRFNCNCNCICGAKDNMFKVEQDGRLIQFLMGLNEREIKPKTPMFMESASLNASSSGKKVMASSAFNANGSAGASTSRSMRSNYSYTDNLNFRTNYSQTASYIGNKPRIICDYCKKSGHTRDKCYKLHGYPQTNNQNANTSIQNRYRGNNQNPRFSQGNS